MIVRIRWTPIKIKKLAWPRSKLLLGVLLLAPGLPVSTIADVPPRMVVHRAPIKRPSPAETLAAFMRRQDFAEPYHVPEIIQAASEASIPPSMIVCIEFVESSGGKHFDAATNNPLGWHNGKASFPSIREAIRHVSAELGSGRWYAGKTLEEKLRVYNPRPTYSVKVMECMRQFPD
ncbi:MAG: hypothetical protein ABSF22_00225 [Bryobacteraceae bacterium]